MQLPQIIVDGLLLLITAYLAFFKSYVQEKGKNLATQEDIGKITTIVEEIRTGLNNETELLKSKLSLYNQNKFSLKTAERDALFSLNKAYSSWLYSLMSFSFVAYDENNISDLEKVPVSYDQRRYDFDLAQCQLKLFMQDGYLVNLLLELTVLTLGLEKILVDHIGKYKFRYIQYNIEKENPQINKLEAYKNLHNDVMPIVQGFQDSKIDQYTKVVAKSHELANVIKERIAQISDD